MLLEDLMDRRYVQEQTRCSETHRKGMKPASLGSGAGELLLEEITAELILRRLKLVNYTV